ncbi:tyrosine-type recombinase/integrase [Paenibacillus roseipurpureus]|uniref:Site-specific integrase n=1 Tax=Paenibacillus roseopurpureus TaxID=2918901 RepID=A0AA96RL91_9BACL|nr:site-specific integrase [Paenibacillus sp. MBLB1832]WNR45111.1 site-specific integrase [Paenibacillus sp. MBLB1832]
MASVQKRGKDSYLLSVDVGKGADGKRVRYTKTVKASGIREARKMLAEFQTEVEVGEYIAPQKMTFGAFVEEWRDKYGAKELMPKTLDIYLRFLENRVLPVFGHQRLDAITPFQLVQFFSKLSEEGSRQDGKNGSLSSGTIHYIHRVMCNVFARAVEWRIIKNSPAADIKKPKVIHKQYEVYDEEEIAELFQGLEKEKLHWRVMILLAITTGLRRGELVGLEWKHINFEKGVLEVKQSISMSENGRRVITEPKTKKSKRKVSLSSAVIIKLKELYVESCHKRDALGNLWKGEEHFFVFSNQEGMAYYPETPYLWFREFLKKNHLRYITFHQLRHYSASYLIQVGVHPKVISERLGHANISTTMNIYGHVLQSVDREAANKFDSIIPQGHET